MKKIYAIAALLLMGISSLSAQTMSISIDGQEVKNGDNVVITKPVKESVAGPFTFYDLGVDVVFRTNISQTVNIEGIDLDAVSPGLACCPTGFSCTTANAENGWLSTGTMNDLEAGREVKGEWIHYNYNRTKPAEGTSRKSRITFRGTSETITFDLTINMGDPTPVESLKADASDNAPLYNVAGQRVNEQAKGILIRNGKKYLK